ncbi:unnamed protein product [Discosporangium mesarthrocarpum]
MGQPRKMCGSVGQAIFMGLIWALSQCLRCPVAFMTSQTILPVPMRPCLAPRLGMSMSEEDMPQRRRSSLTHLASKVDANCKEMCVMNEGRPLAAAMVDFVDGAVAVYLSGYSKRALRLELQLQDDGEYEPGRTMTAAEKQYRKTWLSAIYMVLEELELVEKLPAVGPEEFHLRSQVEVVLRGRRLADEQTFVKFDKSLLSGGVAGGAASGESQGGPQRGGGCKAMHEMSANIGS